MATNNTRATAQVHKTTDQLMEEVWEKTAGKNLSSRATLLPDGHSKGEGGVTGKPGELVGKVGPDQIAAWKTQYPDGVYKIVSDAGHVGYFKDPSRSDVNCALSKADAKKPLAVLEEFAELTFIGGSRALLDNNAMFSGACSELKSKMNGIPAKLVNL